MTHFSTPITHTHTHTKGRTYNVTIETSLEYFQQEDSTPASILENVSLSYLGVEQGLMKTNGADGVGWLVLTEISDSNEFTNEIRQVCSTRKYSSIFFLVFSHTHTHTHTQECESLMTASESNTVLTNRIRSAFSSKGWSASFTNAFKATARLRTPINDDSGVSDTTIAVTLGLGGCLIIIVVGFVLYATVLNKR